MLASLIKIEYVRIVQVNSLPAARERLAPKKYVDQSSSHSLEETTSVRTFRKFSPDLPFFD